MSPWVQLQNEPIVEGFRELAEAKKAFAKASLYNPDNAYQAALVVFGFDVGKAMRASSEWPNDADVIAEKERLIGEYGTLHFLPDKSVVARKIINIADTESKSVQERLLAYRLYSDLMGFIEKPGQSGGNTNNVFLGGSNRVMVVNSAGNDDEWAERAKNHQARLVQQAAEDIGADDEVVDD